MKTNILVLTMIAALYSCGESPKTEKESAPIEAEETTVVEITEPEEPESNWEYTSQTNEMDGNTTYFAGVESLEEKEFDFPYAGGSTLAIMVRNIAAKNDVVIIIDNGQFIPGIMNNEYVRFKFDEADPEKYFYASAEDGSSNYIFPKKSKELIEKLKKAKNVKIEAPFYQEGRVVFDFNVEGLEWDK